MPIYQDLSEKNWKLIDGKLDHWHLNWYTQYNARFYIIIGGRRYGKTYDPKYLAIKNFFQKGEQYIYVRRRQNELDAVKDTLFNDVAANMGVQVRCEGKKLFVREEPTVEDENNLKPSELKKKYPWKLFGYAIALSSQMNFKSASMPNVTMIHYDEFIAEDGPTRELPNEFSKIETLYESIGRGRAKFKFVFTANAESLDNVMMRAYKITLDELRNGRTYNHHSYTDKIVRRNNGKVLFVYTYSEHNAQIVNQTLSEIAGKSSESSIARAVFNKFDDDNDNFLVNKLPKGYRYSMTLTDGTNNLHIWRSTGDSLEQSIWISDTRGPKDVSPVYRSVDRTKPIPNAPYVQGLLTMLRQYTYSLMVTYSSPESRHLWSSFLL